ncbi:MAG: hypothetical protein K2Y37_08685 [Pirellulales bacterium]|nr:hypothetical protein [Pirellulales bacterium]
MASLARYVAASGLLLVCWQLTGAQQPGAPSDTPASADLDVRYAEAQLALARANLKRAESANQRVPNAVAASVVAAYKNDVDVARLRVEQLKAGGPESIKIWLRAAEVNWKLADARYHTALAANQRTPNTISPFDVERYRCRAEVCRLGFERGQAVADQPREQQLEWRIGMLNDQIERLNEAVFRSPPTRTIDPFWWYW